MDDIRALGFTAATGTAEAAFGEHHPQRMVGLHPIAPARLPRLFSYT
jgi:hypothetical protein